MQEVKKSLPITVKNISKGPTAISGKGVGKIQLDAGKSYSWPTEKEYAPYKVSVTALFNAGILQTSEVRKEDLTPAKLEQELHEKEAKVTSQLQEQSAAASVVESPVQMNEPALASEVVGDINAAIDAGKDEKPAASSAKPAAQKPSGKKNK